MTRSKTGWLVLGSAFVVALAGVTPVVYAHGGDPTLVHACVNKSSGEVKIVGANASCKNNESAVDWPGTSAASTGTVRTVVEVQIDPSADGDETFSYSSRTDHYAKISAEAVSLTDPPLIQVLYRPNPQVLGDSLPAPDTMSVAPLIVQSTVLLIREGQVLVLYKRVFTTGLPIFFASPEPDGLIHLRVVVVK